MAVQSTVGTTLGVSAAAPATYTASGYQALTFTLIGEVTDAGTMGPKRNLISHTPINSGITQKFSGTIDQGERALQLALDNKDPGQVILKAAVYSGTPHSFKVMYPNGDIEYFPAVVTSFERSVASADNLIGATVNLAITTSKTGVGIIEVLVP